MFVVVYDNAGEVVRAIGPMSTEHEARSKAVEEARQHTAEALEFTDIDWDGPWTVSIDCQTWTVVGLDPS